MSQLVNVTDWLAPDQLAAIASVGLDVLASISCRITSEAELSSVAGTAALMIQQILCIQVLHNEQS
jgi:hypothetical protein